ncbi:MAG: hypothetical protein NVV72_01160 [Asticcacaulis sp.]|nr:hypothetical protein [Asticcacaulis sp.]
MTAGETDRIVCTAFCGFMACPRRATLADVLAEALDRMESRPGLMTHDFSEDCADWLDPDRQVAA